jgi:hypothetical protein
MMEFTGSSDSVQGALDEAIRAAQVEIIGADILIKCRLKEIRGEVGGFAGVRTIAVIIDADKG